MRYAVIVALLLAAIQGIAGESAPDVKLGLAIGSRNEAEIDKLLAIQI